MHNPHRRHVAPTCQGITMRMRRSSLDISSEDWFIIPPLPSVKAYLRRGTAREMLGYYKEADEGIKYNEVIVDNCSMQLVSKLQQFDVMVTSNLYGTLVVQQLVLQAELVSCQEVTWVLTMLVLTQPVTWGMRDLQLVALRTPQHCSCCRINAVIDKLFQSHEATSLMTIRRHSPQQSLIGEAILQARPPCLYEFASYTFLISEACLPCSYSCIS